jgi:hypothetical protein
MNESLFQTCREHLLYSHIWCPRGVCTNIGVIVDARSTWFFEPDSSWSAISESDSSCMEWSVSGSNEQAYVHKDSPQWIPIFSSYINIEICWLDLTAHYQLMFAPQLHGAAKGVRSPISHSPTQQLHLFPLPQTRQFVLYIHVVEGSVTGALCALHLRYPKHCNLTLSSIKCSVLGCGRLKSNFKLPCRIDGLGVIVPSPDDRNTKYFRNIVISSY